MAQNNAVAVASAGALFAGILGTMVGKGPLAGLRAALLGVLVLGAALVEFHVVEIELMVAASSFSFGHTLGLVLVCKLEERFDLGPRAITPAPG